MKLLITICGRAGSKGVRNKNIKLFLGKPLLCYTIAAARLFREKSRADVDICVNSDSGQILNLAEEYDLACIKRPEELAQDDSPKVPVIRYSLQYMEEKLGKKYDFIMDLDITSPFRTVTDIENTIHKLTDQPEADVVFSVVPARRNPYFNMVEYKDGKFQKVLGGEYTARQQAPAVFDMNASIYGYRRNSLLNRLKNSPLDGVFDVIFMKDTAVLDIDSEEDFRLLEVLAHYFFKGEFKELYDYTCKM
ncbi:cytidylyltransferase domain-containing protein [Caproiciproducens galactitolivorans]|uniref:Acylneuraminate cytidylyltransferase family protein n=1 Tax=Caproiciproducens galactitolivorans TaxID=642589 RepID=A0ABT4BPS9_9FIRM|nr:acylneuraminate cytidylyltransferase family protein [Caproiciproducens galactitolivorans]MCY1712896.1 acylneuraminate cytidylyltransferase family protein [Caproiciproducens galactitolivorans]